MKMKVTQFSSIKEQRFVSAYKHKHYAASGFTFVEMAIVITIMGLIAAGVLVGQQLLESARMKAMISEVSTLKTAVGQFQSIYNSLPGDMADATDFWSGSTTDGDSNGQIAAETSNEAFAALDQLALAGFIDGSYDGAWGSAFDRGGNVIASKLERGAMMYVQCCGGEGDSSLEFINQVVVFSGITSNTARGGVLTPEEAKAIDVKMDDGNPDMGMVGANGNSNTQTDCFTGTTTGAAYDLSNEDTGCQMYFGYNWE